MRTRCDIRLKVAAAMSTGAKKASESRALLIKESRIWISREGRKGYFRQKA